MVTMSITGIWVLSTLARPIDKVKLSIFFGMVLLGILIFTVPISAGYFGFTSLTMNQLLIAAGLGIQPPILSSKLGQS